MDLRWTIWVDLLKKSLIGQSQASLQTALNCNHLSPQSQTIAWWWLRSKLSSTKKRIWAHTKCTISHGINHHSIMMFYFNPMFLHRVREILHDLCLLTLRTKFRFTSCQSTIQLLLGIFFRGKYERENISVGESFLSWRQWIFHYQ